MDTMQELCDGSCRRICWQKLIKTITATNYAASAARDRECPCGGTVGRASAGNLTAICLCLVTCVWRLSVYPALGPSEEHFGVEAGECCFRLSSPADQRPSDEPGPSTMTPPPFQERSPDDRGRWVNGAFLSRRPRTVAAPSEIVPLLSPSDHAAKMGTSRSAQQEDLQITHAEDAVPSGSTSVPGEKATNKDKAAEFLASVGGGTTFTPEEEKAVLRRIDFRVLPIILGAYFFQQLDKSSLSYVSIFGITQDAHLVGKQYSWLGSILYVAQLVMQPLAAVLLVKAPTGKVIASAVLLWGSTLAIMSACKNFPSLLGLRFMLGTFESLIGKCLDELPKQGYH